MIPISITVNHFIVRLLFGHILVGKEFGQRLPGEERRVATGEVFEVG
jgi:hypothetical protein